MTDKEFQLERELSDAKATIRRLEGELKSLRSGDKRTKPLAENRVDEAYYENGQLKSRANYKDGNCNGLRETWLENGQLLERETYKDDKLDGLCESWYENGQLDSRINYKDDKVS